MPVAPADASAINFHDPDGPDGSDTLRPLCLLLVESDKDKEIRVLGVATSGSHKETKVWWRDQYCYAEMSDNTYIAVEPLADDHGYIRFSHADTTKSPSSNASKLYSARVEITCEGESNKFLAVRDITGRFSFPDSDSDSASTTSTEGRVVVHKGSAGIGASVICSDYYHGETSGSGVTYGGGGGGGGGSGKGGTITMP